MKTIIKIAKDIIITDKFKKFCQEVSNTSHFMFDEFSGTARFPRKDISVRYDIGRDDGYKIETYIFDIKGFKKAFLANFLDVYDELKEKDVEDLMDDSQLLKMAVNALDKNIEHDRKSSSDSDISGGQIKFVVSKMEE